MQKTEDAIQVVEDWDEMDKIFAGHGNGKGEEDADDK